MQLNCQNIQIDFIKVINIIQTNSIQYKLSEKHNTPYKNFIEFNFWSFIDRVEKMGQDPFSPINVSFCFLFQFIFSNVSSSICCSIFNTECAGKLFDKSHQPLNCFLGRKGKSFSCKFPQIKKFFYCWVISIYDNTHFFFSISFSLLFFFLLLYIDGYFLLKIKIIN